jgi:hypothetical protein
MKNVYLIPTDKPSSYVTNYMEQNMQWQNIYITSDEEIKEGYWVVYNNELQKSDGIGFKSVDKKIILTTDQDLIKDGVQAVDDEFLEWFVKNSSCEFVEVASLWEDGDLGTYNSYQIIIPQEEPKQEIDTSKYIMGIDPYEKQETLEEAGKIDLTKLCYYDRRNPDFQIKEEYGYDKEEVEATGNYSKKDCACDNCFYGRSKLTEQLIWQAKRMYSGEQVRQAMFEAYVECENGNNFFNVQDKIIQSLKQHKKD